jgi:hypothetical protein
MGIKTIAIFSFFLTTLRIFAQSNNESEVIATHNDNMPALSRPQSDPVMDGKVRMVEKRYSEYRQWFFQNVDPLAQEGKNKGIQVTQEEISAQEKAFKALFPGIDANPNDISDEIVARKYSKTLDGASIATGTVQNAYTQLQSGFSNEPMPPIAAVQPMLETRALAGNRTVQLEIEKLTKQMQRQQNEAVTKASETWEPSDLLIHAADDECLALYKDNDSCYLTVNKFNRYIRYKDVSKFLSLDSARIWGIKQILTDLYLAQQARNKKFTENTDTVAEANRNWIQRKIHGMKYKGIGSYVLDNKEHSAAYSAYYDALFSERRFPYYSLIGSSDSVYMDSIAKAMKADMSKKGQKDDDGSKALHGVGLPWSYSAAVPLPEELDTSTDSLKSNDVSGVIKTAYGFFIVRLDSSRIRYALPPEEVIDDLIFLATKRKWKNLDSSLEARAYKIYSRNKRLNQTPDILRVIAFLTPAGKQAPVPEGGKGSIKGKNKSSEQVREKGIIVLSTQLPSDIRDSLLNRFEASKDKKRMIGPIASRYGVWNFKVIDVVSHGGGIAPFSWVKKRLIDSMAVHELEFTPDKHWLKPDSALKEIALANTYSRVFFGTINDFHDDQSNPDGSDARHGVKGGAENESPHLKKMESMQSHQAELDAWLSKISIRLSAIARK